MARTRIPTLGAIVGLSLTLAGGTAYAASGDPTPTPDTRTLPAAAARQAVDGQRSSAAAAGMPAMPADAQPQQQLVAAAGVRVVSYTAPRQRRFGFMLSGLEASDTVEIRWRTVLNPVGVTSFNAYRGPHPELGFAYWDSGSQPGWTTAAVTVLRQGAPVATLDLKNDKPVEVAGHSNGAWFDFQVANAQPGDHMTVQWTLRDGSTGRYDGPAADIRRHVPRWSTATISVYAGTDPGALIAHPLTISSPAAAEG